MLLYNRLEKHRTKLPQKTATIHRQKKHTNSRNLSSTQLAQHRRSLSESDLLHEIDKCLVLARGFLFARGGGW